MCHAPTNLPERVIPDLLSHLARPTRDILQELVRRHVLHAQEDLPYTWPKRRVLQKQAIREYLRLVVRVQATACATYDR